MMILYNIAYFVFVLISIPILIIKGKWHGGFWMRFGIWPEALAQELKHKSNIWLHAVSVGEIFAIQELIRQLKETFPTSHIVVSTVTKTGYELAAHKFKEETVVYAPLDFQFCVERYIHFIKPRMYISAETEIWPHLFLAFKHHQIKIALVNGRISQKSLNRYQFVKPFLKPILEAVTYFCMQTVEDAERIQSLGALTEKIVMTGNMKFDDLLEDIPARLKSVEWLSKELLWLAGSTHPGEEAIVLRVFKELQSEFKQLRLMIAPRHVERVNEIVDLIRRHDLTARRFSQFQAFQLADYEVMVVDTIGDLRHLYNLASVVFVGKSLTAHGGQNILEPAYYAKPIMVGPYMQNFKDLVGLFKKNNALKQIQNEKELADTARELLRDSAQRNLIGQSAQKTMLQHRGATARTLKILSQVLSAV